VVVRLAFSEGSRFDRLSKEMSCQGAGLAVARWLEGQVLLRDIKTLEKVELLRGAMTSSYSMHRKILWPTTQYNWMVC
jgi:hypothetical protein